AHTRRAGRAAGPTRLAELRALGRRLLADALLALLVIGAAPPRACALGAIGREIDADLLGPAGTLRACAADPAHLGRARDHAGRRLAAAAHDRAVLIDTFPLLVVGQPRVALHAVGALADERRRASRRLRGPDDAGLAALTPPADA